MCLHPEWKNSYNTYDTQYCAFALICRYVVSPPSKIGLSHVLKIKAIFKVNGTHTCHSTKLSKLHLWESLSRREGPWSRTPAYYMMRDHSYNRSIRSLILKESIYEVIDCFILLTRYALGKYYPSLTQLLFQRLRIVLKLAKTWC